MLRWLFSLWAWECCVYQQDFEVERNLVTGRFRHRGIGRISGTTYYGPWIPGIPTEVPPPVDLDEIVQELRDVELRFVLGSDCVERAGLGAWRGLD